MTSGDFFAKEGEWYFSSNGHRYPSKGNFLLSKNETFEPPAPKPTLYSAMLTGDSKPHKVEIKVKEEDLIKDDVMLEGSINVFFENKDEQVELHSKNGKVNMKLRVSVKQASNW